MSHVGEKVIQLHASGIKSIDIAHRLNVAQATVHYHLRRLNELPADDAPARPRAGRPAGSGPKTRELVAALLANGLTRAEIARRLGVGKPTVTYHARRIGEDIDERFGRRFDWRLVPAYYDEGHGVRDCAKIFGFSTWAWQGAVQRGMITPRPCFKPLEEIFAANSRHSRGHLKPRLLRLGLKDGSCERCGLSEWRGAPISMQLHHVNGDRLDHRIENLELLCPNCHSQTETYSGRNGRPGKPSRATVDNRSEE